jgi:glycosyltransferase involved in cell wall biosynthesis
MRYRGKSRRKIVLDVGALYEVKGQAKILERALPWLNASRYHYLVFVGGTRTAPSYVEGMKRLVVEHGLQRQVRFLGSREDVPRLLGLADALVAYSSVEGIPRVVMEAMLAGRPVIVSNTPGMDEVVVDGEVGRVVDFDAAENALAQAMQDLTDRPERWQEMGRQARVRATNLYSTKAMSEAIQAIYNELLESRVNAQAKP